MTQGPSKRVATVAAAQLGAGALAVNGATALVLIVLSRSLPPGAFSGAAAVFTLAFVMAVVPGALQLRAAAAAVDGRPSPAVSWRPVAALAGLVALAAPVLAPVLGTSPLAVIAVGALALPTSALAIRRGTLLGQQHFGAVGASFAVEAAGRLVLGTLLGRVWGADGLAVALLLTAGVALEITPAPRRSAVREQARDATSLPHAAAALALLALAANLDVLVAPGALGRIAADHYDVAAVPARGVYVALLAAGMLVFPSARRSVARRAVLLPLAATVGAGVVLTGGLLVARPVIGAVLGRGRPDAVVLLALGVGMALAAGTSVAVNAAIARGARHPWTGLVAALAPVMVAGAAGATPRGLAAAVLGGQAVGLALSARVALAGVTTRPVAPPTRRRTIVRAAVPELSVVIPAYNEAGRLGPALAGLADAVDRHAAEVVVVDDGSTDATADVARAGLAPFASGRLVRLPSNAGKGAAVRIGVGRARGDAVVYMDADLASDLDGLPRLLDALDRVHVAVGSRALPASVAAGASPARVHMGRQFNRLVRLLTPLELLDTQCGFKAFRRPAAKLLFSLSQVDGFAFDVEVLTLATRIGYRLEEVPVDWHAVPGSKVRLVDPFGMAADLVRSQLRLRRPPLLAVIEALQRSGHDDGHAAAAALDRSLPDAGPVVAWQGMGVAFLPFATPEQAARTAEALADRMGGFRIRADALQPAALLASRSGALREALARS